MSIQDCRDRLPITALWSRLGLSGAEHVGKVRQGGKEAKIRSPFREDKNPSFSVWITAEGVGYWKDHGSGEKAGDEVELIARVKGCDAKEAIKIYHDLAGVPLGKPPGPPPKKPFSKTDWKPKAKPTPPAAPDPMATPPKAKPARGKLVETYDYHAPDGSLAHQTLRYDPKTFRQRRPAVEGDTESDSEGWVWTLRDAAVFPFNLPAILSAPVGQPVFLVEGEKDALNMERAGLLATTLPMGAGKWRPEYAQWFSGRWVVIIPDHDPVGKDGKRVGDEGARKVAGHLLDGNGRVSMLDIPTIWPEAREGQDISDWLESGWAADVPIDDQSARLLDLAQSAGVPEELAYEGCLVDDDSTVAVFEDRIARRLVKVGGYLFCGSAFWEWDRRCGIYQKLEGRLKLENRVREAMRVAKAEKKISHSKVKSIVGLAESENYCMPEDLNRAPGGWLCVKNGMLDVMTGQLHRSVPEYLTTVQCPHDYLPGAECPNWIQWLIERQPDQATRDQLQEMFGYCLVTDENYHSFFFLYGDGGTGKSTCVKVLEELIGNTNIKSMELEDLDNPFTRASLVGKSLYLCKELTASSFKHIGLIKAIVSGDRISADVKYGRGFDFIPKGRLVMESNVIAATPDSSAGFSRRFIQISWEHPIERIDYGLEKKLISEISGILNWALEGYRRLKARGRFEHTDRSAEATKQLLLHRAQVPSFLDSGSVLDHGVEEQTALNVADLFRTYQEWCEDHDVVAFYKERPAFMREVMSRRPAWRKRKVRAWRDGELVYILKGLELTQKDD